MGLLKSTWGKIGGKADDENAAQENAAQDNTTAQAADAVKERDRQAEKAISMVNESLDAQRTAIGNQGSWIGRGNAPRTVVAEPVKAKKPEEEEKEKPFQFPAFSKKTPSSSEAPENGEEKEEEKEEKKEDLASVSIFKLADGASMA